MIDSTCAGPENARIRPARKEPAVPSRSAGANAARPARHGAVRGGGELLPGLSAARASLGLVAALLALAAIAWWSTAQRMGGMDDGPGTDLGALGWFEGVWVVMMAAMMFPSVSPTVALYARMARRGPRIA